jgi:hypothetical protein
MRIGVLHQRPGSCASAASQHVQVIDGGVAAGVVGRCTAARASPVLLGVPTKVCDLQTQAAGEVWFPSGPRSLPERACSLAWIRTCASESCTVVSSG